MRCYSLNDGDRVLKNISTMSPQKRERYAQWLRDTGVEHPSDELIDRTQKRALLKIDEAKTKMHRYKVELIALVFCLLVTAACAWVRLYGFEW